MGKKALKVRIPVTVEELVDGYLEKRRLGGISKFAYEDHKGALRRFFQSYPGAITDDINLKSAVMAFLVGKNNEHYDKTLQVLRAFFNHCIDEEVLTDNPTNGLKYKPHTVRIVDHDVQTIRTLLKLPDKRTFPGYRDWVFMVLLLDSGIRPFETLSLRIKDVQGTYVRVREEVAKTRQERYLPISPIVVQAIKKLINARHESWDNDNGYIFCSFSGWRLTSRQMQLRFREYSKKLGVSVTTYHLRHVMALYYCRNGGDIFSLRELLGHRTLTMTQKYVAMAQTDVRNNHAKATPIRNFLEEEKRVISMSRQRNKK